ALQVPLHWTESSPGWQATVMSGGVQFAMALQLPSQLASTFASTVHWPPEIERPQLTCAEAPGASAAWMAVLAWLHASLTSLSLLEAMAVHVSVTPRSVSMPMQAWRTESSRLPAMSTRSA